MIREQNRSAGFTLIELMIVMGIILTLMALLFAGGIRYRERARVKNTESTILTLGLKIDEYHSAMGIYPPDGIDGDTVRSAKSLTPLVSGAALAYALSQPLKRYDTRPTGEKVEVVHAPIHEFQQDDLEYLDRNDRQVAEIIDAWGYPLHYDCLEGGADDYSIQGDGWEHLDGEGGSDHNLDPREAVGEAVIDLGPQNLGKYDIWSHGAHGHTAEEEPSEVIANWPKPGEDQ